MFIGLTHGVHRTVFAVVGRGHQMSGEFVRVELGGCLLLLVNVLCLVVGLLAVGQHLKHEDVVEVTQLGVLLFAHLGVLCSDPFSLHGYVLFQLLPHSLVRVLLIHQGFVLLFQPLVFEV